MYQFINLRKRGRVMKNIQCLVGYCTVNRASKCCAYCKKPCQNKCLNSPDVCNVWYKAEEGFDQWLNNELMKAREIIE